MQIDKIMIFILSCLCIMLVYDNYELQKELKKLIEQNESLVKQNEIVLSIREELNDFKKDVVNDSLKKTEKQELILGAVVFVLVVCTVGFFFGGGSGPDISNFNSLGNLAITNQETLLESCAKMYGNISNLLMENFNKINVDHRKISNSLVNLSNQIRLINQTVELPEEFEIPGSFASKRNN